MPRVSKCPVPVHIGCWKTYRTISTARGKPFSMLRSSAALRERGWRKSRKFRSICKPWRICSNDCSLPGFRPPFLFAPTTGGTVWVESSLKKCALPCPIMRPQACWTGTPGLRWLQIQRGGRTMCGIFPPSGLLLVIPQRDRLSPRVVQGSG